MNKIKHSRNKTNTKQNESPIFASIKRAGHNHRVDCYNGSAENDGDKAKQGKQIKDFKTMES